MKFYNKKRISVIVERACRDKVIRLIEKSGASGFTVYKEITGKGRHGITEDHGALGTVSGNVEIVSITGPEVAGRILAGVAEMIDRGIIMIVHVIDVNVIRDEHFQ